ncbi:MAG: PaaI family thioesterase [Candidatus Methanomethylophilaceae archaeon]
MEDADFLAVMSPDIRCYLDRVKELYNAPYARANGIEMVSLSGDEIRLAMEIKPGDINSIGFCHGGATYGLTDHTLAFASNLKEDAVGQNCNIIYHRPAKSGRLESVSKRISNTKSISVFEICVYCEGKHISTAICTTFKIKRD